MSSSVKVAQAAEQAVLERVAAALEAALPEADVELIMSEERGRMHRVIVPGLEEPVYVHVQASAFGKLIAAKVLEGKGVSTTAKAATE